MYSGVPQLAVDLIVGGHGKSHPFKPDTSKNTQGYRDSNSRSRAYTYLHFNTNMKKQTFTFIKDLDYDGLCVILTPDDGYMIVEENALADINENELELENIKEGQEILDPGCALLAFDKDSFFSVIDKLNEIKRL